MTKITKDILRKVYPPRKPDAKKYDYGLLLVIGGGQFYTGSPAFAAMAAFRAGVDMVQVLAPKRAADIISSFSPNLAAYPLKGNWLDEEDLPILISMTEAARAVAGENVAVVIGGGLGRSEGTKKTILEYLKRVPVKAVIDADGIHALAKSPEIVKGKNFLLTPHSFEFSILTGKDISGLSGGEKKQAVIEAAKNLQTTILLKGKVDILVSNGEDSALNRTGSPFMTVGGTGDTLAGIAGAILAMGKDCLTAGSAASFINGLAGEKAAKRLGASLLASDLIEEIPNVLKEVKQDK